MTMTKYLKRIPALLWQAALVVLLFLRDVWVGTLEALARGDHVSGDSQDDVHEHHWDLEESTWNKHE